MTNHGPHGAARRLVLTVSCPDRSGIVAAITGFIASHGGWVAEAAQHSDLTTGRFFQRIEVLADSLPFGPEEFGERFAGVAEEFRLDFQVRDSGVPKRIVLLASREDHCLADVLHRWRRGDLRCEIPLVVSNHPDLEALVDWYGIGFRHVPVGAERKEEAFDAIAALVDGAGADLVVLARYMQILPASFCARYPERIVNIHHSFLPSFVGARPYHQAFERGVKLIGATCHYVTPELDAGPIIEQDTARIDHADSVQDLLRIGRDIERAVLARALRWLLEDRVLLNGARTVVFA
ncbi:MAG TPA: formyltetrahydrofolate deformylase [Acidimicrobiales bacterium]|nr:formyltetrahydrofolate deformylase [Acidimicrobiales bacterium]